MAALQPSAPGEQPPPDLPNMPDVSETLSRYLRTFSLWCRNGFRDKLTISASLPGVLIQATDRNVPNPAVYRLDVTTPGVATLSPVALGTGKVGAPVPVAPVGVTDGSNAPAGAIGEVISNVRVVASALTLANGVVQNVCTITLTPGDWDVQGNAWFSVGTGGATNIHTGLTSVSATIPLDASIGWIRYTDNIALTASAGQMRSLGPCRVNVSASTPFYLYASVSFPSGTCTVYGALWARRIR
jgi:hypothetical protein